MHRLRLAAASVDQTPLDWAGNLARCRRALARARERGAQVVVLPELALTGYGCEDAFQAPHVERQAWRLLGELLPDTAGLVVVAGMPCAHRGSLYNVGAATVDGALAGLVAKQNLASYGVYYEPRWFRAWPAGAVARVDARGLPTVDGSGRTPLGDVVLEIGGVRIGVEVCEDAWVADRPGTRLAERAVDVVLNPSASHFYFGRREDRERLVAESSRALRAAYVYANLLGNESGRVIFDGASMVAADGELVAITRRFSFAEVQVADAVVEVGAVRRTSSVTDEPGTCVEIADFGWEDAGAPSRPFERTGWEDGPDVAFEEFARGVALGLFDYLRKARSRGFVVSLSGGADSSATAALVAGMVSLGEAELGRDGFARAIGFEPSDEGMVGRLLTTAYQATDHSSEATRDAAARLAEGLGARHHEMDVQPIVDAYRALAEAAEGRSLEWDRDDLTLQNLQARARGPSVWALANLRNAILLATSNRSEAAVGYATMDGDTCGGLSPIAGVDKTFVREWLRWLETTGPDGIGPVPALAATNALTPTAELRPPEHDQRDEEDLMPYPVLDAIAELAIRDRLAPQPVLDALAIRFPEAERGELVGWVRRFFRLWARNQWKRERIAPSFHLDDESLDPKTWCRYPILGGDWGEELAALE